MPEDLDLEEAPGEEEVAYLGETVEATNGRVDRFRKRIAKQVSHVGLMKWLLSHEPSPFCALSSTLYPSRYQSCFPIRVVS